MKIVIIIVLLFLSSCTDHLQTEPFQIAIESFKIEGLGGVQSYAYGQYDG